MSSKYTALKQECYEANMQLNALKLVVYTFGNVSAVDRENGVFAIKPSGVAYEELKPEDIVIVDFDNNIIEGSMLRHQTQKRMPIYTKTGQILVVLLILTLLILWLGLKRKETFQFLEQLTPTI